jgi:NAD(P)-dependent dehydrogenase (short-subunit alcohol dehydrogenase family)
MANVLGVAVVTGSTSGIGRAIALRLLSSGYGVVANYSSNAERAADVFDDFKLVSSDVLLVKADVARADEAGQLVGACIQKFGQLDVLINNAATVADNSILEMTEDEWDRVLDVNLKGAFLCSQLAARQMLTQDSGGTILNIGAPTGIRARRDGANTCASKAGLALLTQCLALELAPKVRANTIIPGLTITEETESRFRLNDPRVRQEREQAIPLRRLGRPEDIADAVMLMLAGESRFITGQRIIVDGGQNMW